MPAARQIDVYLLPALVEPERTGRQDGRGDRRAAGHDDDHPRPGRRRRRKSCRAWKSTKPGSSRLASFAAAAVLGGERGGLPIPGFDLGNSPAEYTRERVGGKTVVFTTTNGTRAMHPLQGRPPRADRRIRQFLGRLPRAGRRRAELLSSVPAPTAT